MCASERMRAQEQTNERSMESVWHEWTLTNIIVLALHPFSIQKLNRAGRGTRSGRAGKDRWWQRIKLDFFGGPSNRCAIVFAVVTDSLGDAFAKMQLNIMQTDVLGVRQMRILRSEKHVHLNPHSTVDRPGQSIKAKLSLRSTAIVWQPNNSSIISIAYAVQRETKDYPMNGETTVAFVSLPTVESIWIKDRVA